MTFAGGAVSWQSRLQKCVALSTTEPKYTAATETCKELLWLKRFMQELSFMQQRCVVLCDNESTIHLAKNAMFHTRTKHVDVRYHWIRDAIEDKLFELEKVHTNDNGSDMFTKPLARETLKVTGRYKFGLKQSYSMGRYKLDRREKLGNGSIQVWVEASYILECINIIISIYIYSNSYVYNLAYFDLYLYVCNNRYIRVVVLVGRHRFKGWFSLQI
ncbi:putative RNA-directed DNA polymerase [Helianthus annuus]|nr:putative RNA-directed DNA polymerase [Helianthus annuus]